MIRPQAVWHLHRETNVIFFFGLLDWGWEIPCNFMLQPNSNSLLYATKKNRRRQKVGLSSKFTKVYKATSSPNGRGRAIIQLKSL